MRTVRQLSRLTGVSVRTLHHYDAIGLLKPTAVTDAGYRLYDDIALARLQSILLFRELQFPLKQIKSILDSPAFDPTAALAQQIRLLEDQQRRLTQILALAREIQEKGVSAMTKPVFDNQALRQYQKEAQAQWGATAAYQEYAARESSGSIPADAARQLMALLTQFGPLRHLAPDHPQALEQAAALRAFITASYYTCTPEIFRSLGQMYTADPRFQANIDDDGGEGTAAFAAQAIARYCDTL